MQNSWSTTAFEYLREMLARVSRGEWYTVEPWVGQDDMESRFFTESTARILLTVTPFTAEVWKLSMEILACVRDMRNNVISDDIWKMIVKWIIFDQYCHSTLMFLIDHGLFTPERIEGYDIGYSILPARREIEQKRIVIHWWLEVGDVNFQEEVTWDSLLLCYLKGISRLIFARNGARLMEHRMWYIYEDTIEPEFMEHHLELLTCLLEKGADPLLENKWGESAWTYLEQMHRWINPVFRSRVIELLRTYL